MRLFLDRVSSWLESRGLRGTPPAAHPWAAQGAAAGSGDPDPVAALVIWQVLGTAIGLGVVTNSWWVFGVALLGFFWLFDHPGAAFILGVVYSIGLGIVAGVLVFGALGRYDAAMVCGLIALALLLTMNLEHVRRLRW